MRTITSDLAAMGEHLGGETFDLVCAHGLLMYLDDPAAALAMLAGRLNPGGRPSFTVRNGDALAYRPGIRGDFAGALAAFGSTAYRNEMGIDATAHTRAQVEGWCSSLGLTIEQWYGVRVLTDGLSLDAQPGDVDLPSCLAAEVEAGRRDPYRHLGSMLHFVAADARS